MIHRMIQRQLFEAPVRKHFGHDLLDIRPFILPPEIVEHQEPAVEKIVSQRHDFLVAEAQSPRFHDIKEGIVDEVRIR